MWRSSQISWRGAVWEFLVCGCGKDGGRLRGRALQRVRRRLRRGRCFGLEKTQGSDSGAGCWEQGGVRAEPAENLEGVVVRTKNPGPAGPIVVSLSGLPHMVVVVVIKWASMWRPMEEGWDKIEASLGTPVELVLVDVFAVQGYFGCLQFGAEETFWFPLVDGYSWACLLPAQLFCVDVNEKSYISILFMCVICYIVAYKKCLNLQELLFWMLPVGKWLLIDRWTLNKR